MTRKFLIFYKRTSKLKKIGVNRCLRSPPVPREVVTSSLGHEGVE